MARISRDTQEKFNRMKADIEDVVDEWRGCDTDEVNPLVYAEATDELVRLLESIVVAREGFANKETFKPVITVTARYRESFGDILLIDSFCKAYGFDAEVKSIAYYLMLLGRLSGEFHRFTSYTNEMAFELICQTIGWAKELADVWKGIAGTN